MPNTRVYTRSFAGGEISPEMFGRIDDAKYQSGAATLRNFIVKPQGPALNRPGTRFVRETKTSQRKSRLIPFTYNTTQTLVLELGVRSDSPNAEGYMRFHTQGATLLSPTIGTISAYKTPSAAVTFTGSTNIVNWASHPLANNDKVFFTGANLPSEIAANRIFYVIGAASGTFQISETIGGSAFDFGNSGGNCNGYYAYERGDLARAGTAPNERAYYFRDVQGLAYSDPVTSPTPTSSAFWYLQPSTGEYEIPTPYIEAHIFDIHHAQSNDIVTFVHPEYPVHELRRVSATKFLLEQMTFQAGVTTPTGLSVTPTRGGSIEINLARRWDNTVTNSNDRVVFEFTSDHGFAKNDTVYIYDCRWNFINDKFYVIQESAQAGLPTQLTIKTYDGGQDVNFNTTGDALADWTCSGDAGTELITTLGGTHNLADQCPVIFNNAGFNVVPSGLTAGTTYYVRNPTATTFRVSATPTGSLIDLLSSTSGFRISIGKTGRFQLSSPTIDTTNSYKVTAVAEDFTESIASSSVTVTNNLFVAGACNTITWTKVAGAIRYNVYKEQSGLYGYIGQVEQPADPTTTASFKDDNIAPDIGRTTPIFGSDLVTANNYPGAVGYYEQRRCFGGTNTQPQAVWMTASGTESNLSYHLPTLDSDRIFFQVAARESNTIRHIVPLQQLVLLTNSAEWRVTSVNGDALTPYTISVKPQSFIGSSNVQPIIVNTSLIYCAARGGHIREMGYNWQANGYITGDLSLRAAHLFDDYEIRDMAYAKSPQPMLWFVSNNGKLLGLTYVPEEQIGSWHQHDTDGEFESCAVIAEGEEDYLYVIVKRTINSVTKRYVERMETRNFTSLASSWFVDSGLTRTAAGTESTVSNLGHLENKVVSVVVNGKVQPSKKVIGGSITLTTPATVGQIITVGLPYTSDLQTLPMILNTEAFGQGIVKNVNKVAMRVYRSSEFYIGPDANRLVKSNVYTTTPSLLTEEVDVMIPPSWASGGQVLLRQTDPLPITVVNMSVEVAIGGG